MLVKSWLFVSFFHTLQCPKPAVCPASCCPSSTLSVSSSGTRSLRENPGNLLAYPVITSIMLRGVLATKLRAAQTLAPSSTRSMALATLPSCKWILAVGLEGLRNDMDAHIQLCAVPLSVCLSVRLSVCVFLLAPVKTKSPEPATGATTMLLSYFSL